MTAPLLRIGTRGSPLALAQAEETRTRLAILDPALAAAGAVEVVVIRTTGDRIQDRTLADAGGKGLFTKEIEEALIEGRIDIAVHSMKDVPTWLPDGLEIACLLPREDPRDAFFSPVAGDPDQLPAGAVVGTASLRRQAQILARRPDLRVVPIRGNVETRLRKLAAGEVDATLLALAGLKRLGLTAAITAILDPAAMLPAVAQGAIGLETRIGDARIASLLAPLNCPATQARVSAERAALEVLDGSCRTPIAALATLAPGDQLDLDLLVARPDGAAVFRLARRGPAAESRRLGREAGAAMRALLPPGILPET